MKWDELSMTQKADVISMAVKAGVKDLNSIKSFYNESVGSRRFEDGGGLSSLPSNWTMQNEAKYRNWRENLPVNLRNTNDNDYDMRRAYLADMQPSLEDDGYYHLGSRDPKTGRILKAPHHPTYLQAINTDARIGYYPTIDKQGVTYTDTWKGNKFGGGGFISLIPMPMVLPKNTEGGKKQRKVMQFLPIVGTAVNAEEAIHNPTQYNIVRTGISAASDLIGLPMWKGVKAGAQLVREGLPTTKEVIKDVTSPWTRNEVRDAFRTGFGYGLPSMDTELDILENVKADGGSIHIAPSKKGTFTAAATKHGMGVQEFASKVLAHPDDYSLTMRKKANFAKNASKWKH